jgi:hypothetical protein
VKIRKICHRGFYLKNFFKFIINMFIPVNQLMVSRGGAERGRGKVHAKTQRLMDEKFGFTKRH